MDRDKERKAAKSMGVAMSVFAIVFAVVWCLMAASMGAWFMLLFGIPFAGLLVYRLMVMLKLTKEDPKHGAQPRQEADPWDMPRSGESYGRTGDFCPYCGFQLQDGFDFCPKCGRRVP